MAVTLTTAARNAAADAVVDLLDGGAGDASGDIAFATAADVIVCVCVMSNPAFGSASAGAATASAVSQGTVAGSGNPSTITKAFFRNRANTEIFRCVVGVGSGDIQLSNNSVNNGDTIDITWLAYSQPA